MIKTHTRMRRLAAALSALGLIAFGGRAALAETEIRASFGFGPKHQVATHVLPDYVKSIETATGGSVKYKIFLGGSLLPFKSVATGIKDGIADMGFYVFSYNPAEFAHANFLAELALLGIDNTAMVGATTEFNLLHCADCEAEFKAQKMVHTSGYSSPPLGLATKGRMVTVDDVRGKKIRVGGGPSNRWVVALGGVPINLPADDQMDAFSSGVIAASIVNIASMKTYNLWDVASDFTLLPLGTFHSVSLFGYNRDLWSKLKASERNAILAATPKAMAVAAIRYDAEGDEVVAAAAQRKLGIHQPSPELAKATDDFAAKDIEQVAKDAEGRGVKGAAAKVAAFRQLVGKWNAIAIPVRRDEAALTAAYKREIYDRLDLGKYGM